MDGASIAVIIVAIIGAIGTILSNIIMNNSQSKDMDAKLDKQQAIVETELKNLTAEVKRHNNFAEEIPTLKADIRNLEKRIDKIETKTDKAG